MSNTTFRAGELVQLKSGGPTMTVRSRSVDGTVNCQWFGGKKLEHGYFNVETLVLAEEGDAKPKAK